MKEMSLRTIDHERFGQPGGTYTCWDELGVLEERSNHKYYKCNKIGMTSSIDLFGDFDHELQN